MSKEFNPLHSVSLGESFPEVVKAIIEIPSGAKAKYELDKESGLLRLDRVLFSSVHYPANYGFIPKTHCPDGDPIDILVLSQISVVPMCIVDARVIGAMHMVDQGILDDKIIAVATGDMSVQHIDDIDQLPKHLLQEVQRFFEDYKSLEGKHVEVAEFASKSKAIEIVRESAELYLKEFPGN